MFYNSKQEMKIMSKKLFSMATAITFMFALGACDVDQTEEGQLPDIEVEDEGQLPAYDVEPAEVEITEDTVTVPDIDIQDPDADENTMRNDGVGTDGEGY